MATLQLQTGVLSTLENVIAVTSLKEQYDVIVVMVTYFDVIGIY